MEPLHAVFILLGGLWAGTINSVVGSGTLVTFPILIALGYAPVMATVSNAMGLIAGGVSGVLGYRRELAGMRTNLLRLLPASLLGGITGAFLLLHLPESVFGVVAPFLIVLALGMVILQPNLQRWVKRRAEANDGVPHRSHTIVMTALVYFAGVYGGYFVAAQGILLVGILGIFMTGTLQNANAVKNVLSLAVNLIAAVSYLLFAPDRIIWAVVGLIAVSSLIGGFVGSRIGRRLSPLVLRLVIVTLGTVALYFMVAKLVAPH
ncbi:sulfite exporter TauE/SafE family protein [Paenarthrobacter sp. PH39-S1]|uniref:sulfite exporter TauE/SafE family protein n=1 Tax=Paenarthrobacter sp. PH39-S1 TaxID=3046204 RepID=UPI0024BAA90D|nr:sulfite exporter TauE/SafE family protein [Paenarthrobacter sp. PH39-S1]MDJ0356723.1 sulfite exporter TauE/SafE family protein [Paenarthrobacter sp. PH39-S1]